MSWIVSFPCTRAEAEALSGEIPALDALDAPPVVVTREIDEDTGLWQLDAYLDDKPDAALLDLLRSLVPSARDEMPIVERLPDEDWVTLSQQGLEPVRAGRFFVHTSSYSGRLPPGTTPFLIDASQAFGTGGHDTTAGCLAMLDRLARRGGTPRNIADIGTGTGLLAFAAMALWPRARVIASDIDPASIFVTRDNAAVNGVPLGRGGGRLALAVAPGTDHPAIRRRAPYDLVIANILAGPLITLAPDIAAATAPGGHAILAGLIARQMEPVLAAYRAQGFRLAGRGGSADWPCLLLVKRRRYGWRRKERAFHRSDPADASFGNW
ncbi:50S ribosomal protein L11 methyltransferase [Sphingopyxis alaskensis]|jgi:ribosomal protein L11 methyltransferase|uniref:Ribosomal protein L11 methyltransferase n=1 Tax=Sphingopyxis alaskensis (strain DSM 13593 / LMG 18877 / RB2256) TaxID=317655 RepID=Q1GVP7_SPHAL|nr:50S ribosomal protein L11 methyltransferase [Sphingopyxis alaskensis]ABF52275.1 LSU ribosomal protein L11P methyltransferase [Sphingopyxis alaskensis RB2256]MCM3419941.1 50S ribosomal protein L11 methyltransferase [Sphingopyxis alaskensis]